MVDVDLLHVLVPYTLGESGPESPEFDTAEFRADVALWIAPLGIEWLWVPVLAGTVGEAVAGAVRAGAMVLNLCDGDDINGYPGLSVVTALEAAGLPFTGADSRFYALSTSKIAMKQRFLAAGVPTSPWAVIDDIEADIGRAAEEIGLPLFIKPDISFGSAGISSASVVADIASGVERVRRLLSGMHGCHFEPGAIFAERFLPGREFTVLVVDGPEGVLAFPGERQFHPGLAAHDRILTFERHSGDFVDDAPPPDDQPSFTYVAVDDGTAASLSALAIAAYAAVDGNGYARVDLKEGVGGAVMVLEVNANCGLGTGALSSAGQLLGLAGRDMMYLLPLLLDHAGHRNQGIS